MKELRIVIDIDEEGRIVADADGFEGDLCLKELDRLLEGLAPDRGRTDRKPAARQTRRVAAATVTAGKKR